MFWFIIRRELQGCHPHVRMVLGNHRVFISASFCRAHLHELVRPTGDQYIHQSYDRKFQGLGLRFLSSFYPWTLQWEKSPHRCTSASHPCSQTHFCLPPLPTDALLPPILGPTYMPHCCKCCVGVKGMNLELEKPRFVTHLRCLLASDSSSVKWEQFWFLL